ncbi:hypothetical protein NJC38_03325 [Pseudomonas sp. 21LCFQ010]|uniref:hypothetical protein n=1 Tax=Pseudomonas sp. 21LCFQ010 TaxID=2957506 RepID=UPI00209705D7|nr:hypothetical protein [Pseudomonas sp. 21LCFQ010]MCO8161182.1 hypothetical protein [Pseudomonas sp. 21LCFQ010]
MFVASCQIFELPDDGQTISLCSWTQGVPSLLPKTDRVALVEPVADGEPNAKVVAWHDVEAQLSGWLALEQGYPERYRTLGFPTAEQLARLTSV